MASPLSFSGRTVSFQRMGERASPWGGGQASFGLGALAELSELGQAAGRLVNSWADRAADVAAELSFEERLDAIRSSWACAPAARQAVDEIEVLDALLPAADDEGKSEADTGDELSTQEVWSWGSDSLHGQDDAQSPLLASGRAVEPQLAEADAEPALPGAEADAEGGVQLERQGTPMAIPDLILLEKTDLITFEEHLENCTSREFDPVA